MTGPRRPTVPDDPRPGADLLPATHSPSAAGVPAGAPGHAAAATTGSGLPVVTRTQVRSEPVRSPTWMLDQLPVGLVQEDFFVRFVGIFQELGSTLLDGADNIEHVADLAVAPPELVRWLASWIGSPPVDPAAPEGLQRRMVEGSARSLRSRGTRAGLVTYLERLTGSSAEVVDGGGVHTAGETPAGDPAWVRMRVASSGALSDRELAELVAPEVPVHVRAELFVGDRVVWWSDTGRASERMHR